jgi:hypothetical protein
MELKRAVVVRCCKGASNSDDYVRTEVTTIPTLATAMTAVATQPIYFSGPVTTKRFMIFGFEPINIIIAITGAETTPFMTALQKSALIGSSGLNVIATPLNIAITIVA